MAPAVKKSATLTPISDKKRVPVAIDEKPKFRLHVDADRDGTVDDDPNGLDTWTPGKGKKGAVLLVNNNGTPALIDHDDNKVNGAVDVPDLTALDIRRTGPTPPAGYKVVLSVSAEDAKHIRIFDTRTAGGKEVLGPGKGEKYELPDLSQAKLELGMEAIRYAGKDFSGDVLLTLTTLDGKKEMGKHQAKLRVAPWIMFNHLDAPEKVYVLTTVRAGADNNAAFVAALSAATSAAGVALERVDGGRFGDDRWMQDIMEFGYSEAPGRGVLRNVLETPRGRSLAGMPKTLVTSDLGYTLPAPVPAPMLRSSLNSGGNLECTPPFTAPDGKKYPFGRVYFCQSRATRPSDRLAPGYSEFLHSQLLQKPILIDAGWLNVGHVDEIISFVPAKTKLGFKLLLASPKLGLDLLNGHPAARLLVGKKYVQDIGAELTGADLLSRGVAWTYVPTPEEVTYFAGSPADLQQVVDASSYQMSGSQIRAFNLECQGKIDSARSKFEKELGLTAADIAHVPILYVHPKLKEIGADALTAGMVNMLVLGKECISPKPFGPMVSGKDLYEDHFRETLAACGLNVTFVDDWDTYHLLKGEVHCGTNTLRKPDVAKKWWENIP